ncbi:MAG: hypothetical protein FWE70_02930 [Oscillospiraceae bacterium]|nr:hypothetical protein [Oscillospiraceae bacterium]
MLAKQCIRAAKAFAGDRSGLGTVEIVIIIAVLVGIALIFRNAIIGFVTGIIDQVFGADVRGQLNPLDMR